MAMQPISDLVPPGFKKWAAKKLHGQNWGRALARQLDEKEVRKLTQPTGPLCGCACSTVCASW